MVDLVVENYRCIQSLELGLSSINVFVGRNSTGKSSLAYAIYLASISSRHGEEHLQTVVKQLYGYGYDKIARITEDGPQYPIYIRLGDHEFSVRPRITEKTGGADRFDVKRPSGSPWTDEYLLPSRRTGYLQFLTLLSKIFGELGPDTTIGGSMIRGMLEASNVSVLPPFGRFALDYIKALMGLKLGSTSGNVKDVGSYTINIAPLAFQLVNIVVKDPYLRLQLPAELAPDGLVDLSIVDSVIKRVPEGSLVVVEEPEIHKNPLLIKEFTQKIAREVLRRKLTLVATTHSDITLLAIAKLASEKELKPEDVKVYYFERKPWTKVSEIKLYEDGTFDRLPDAEEIATQLF